MTRKKSYKQNVLFKKRSGCFRRGGPMYYTGRDMKTTHKGMKISESDWSAFLGHLNATLDALQIASTERDEVIVLMQSTKPDIVEA